MFADTLGMRKDRRSGVDTDALARRALGMPLDGKADSPVVDGVMAAFPRPCVGCGTPTGRIVFEPASMSARPARYATCKEAAWDVAVELVERDELA